MAKSFKEQIPLVPVQSRAELRAWLMEHHGQSTGVWLVLNKKGGGRPYLSYDEVVEEGLCFGWIDSVPNKIDETKYKLMFTPRKTGSGWSKVNKERIERLVANRLMTEWGQAKIDAAKVDGSWEVLDDSEAMVMPEDLQVALVANPTAKEKFEAFSASSKKAILQYLSSAKRPETRTKRIVEIVDKAAVGKRANYPIDK
jgi:uncharacterized protein YdeI (YjbR/CyaY-like superfamily)